MCAIPIFSSEFCHFFSLFCWQNFRFLFPLFPCPSFVVISSSTLHENIERTVNSPQFEKKNKKKQNRKGKSEEGTVHVHVTKTKTSRIYSIASITIHHCRTPTQKNTPKTPNKKIAFHTSSKRVHSQESATFCITAKVLKQREEKEKSKQWNDHTSLCR